MKTMMGLRDALREKFDYEISAAVKRVSGGQAKDYAEYKQVCGRVQGLAKAYDLVDEVFKNLLDEGDDDADRK